MQHVELRPGKDVFLDFGSGKGRALLMAAQYPFKRIVGIEISEQLNNAARANIARWSGRLVCSDIQLRTGDAAHCHIPRDATVLYFYNPFHGPTLRSVFDAIEQSWSCAPRRIWIVFNNTRHIRLLEAGLPWLRPMVRPVFQHECGVYLVEFDSFTRPGDAR
jgi:SAM-dependent methyltransferase